MKPLFPSAKEALLRGQMDLLVDTFKLAMVSGYTYDDTDALLADVIEVVGTPEVITVTNVSGGVAIVDDIVFPDVTGTDPITGLIAYQDGSTALLCYVDQRADTVPLGIVPNGGDLTFSFDHLVKI